VQIDVISACEITDDLCKWWTATQEADSRLASPYFCPEFTAAVASVRNDVYVTVIRDKHELTAILPFQRTRWGNGGPVGGLVSDFQGIIAQENISVDLRTLARSCKVRSWDFPFVLASQVVFQPFHSGTIASPYMELSDGFEAYCDERRTAGSHQIREGLRKARRLAREIGPIHLEYSSDNDSIMKTLFAWKSSQYRATNKPDILRDGWIPDLLRRIHRTKGEHFGGVLSALYAGDRLIAAHFGMRSKEVLHWWYPAYDPNFASHSPGLILGLELAREASLRGISRIDLGYGEERYKTSFMSGATQVAHVVVDATAWRRGVRNRWQEMRRLVRGTPLAAPARAAMQMFRRMLPHR
jgi:CelD/BcsL family acetyltransferase involved in cellulose biosynthesis